MKLSPLPLRREDMETALAALAAGPFVNLAICAATLQQVLSTTYSSSCWNPFVLPIPAELFGKEPLSDLMVITFSLNWMALVLNLVPALPLDGAWG